MESKNVELVDRKKYRNNMEWRKRKSNEEKVMLQYIKEFSDLCTERDSFLLLVYIIVNQASKENII